MGRVYVNGVEQAPAGQTESRNVLVEYDSIADRYGARYLNLGPGALPDGMSRDVWDMIKYDEEAFARRCREFAYARAMNKATK